MMRGNMRSSSHFISFLIFLFYLCFVPLFGLADANNKIHIAVIGDSLVHGYGLLPEEGFVSRLETRLIEEGKSVKLQNLGVSGDTSAGGLARFDWSITNKVQGVIILLGGNDMLRGLNPENTYLNLKQMLLDSEARDLPVLLVGIEAISNFGVEYKSSFDEIFPRLKKEFSVFHYPDFFSALKSDSVETFMSFMQNDHIHPNAVGVTRIITDFLPLMYDFISFIENN